MWHENGKVRKIVMIISFFPNVYRKKCHLLCAYTYTIMIESNAFKRRRWDFYDEKKEINFSFREFYEIFYIFICTMWRGEIVSLVVRPTSLGRRRGREWKYYKWYLNFFLLTHLSPAAAVFCCLPHLPCLALRNVDVDVKTPYTHFCVLIL